MGCHPRREIALLRALTEAAQTRLTVISGARDDLGDCQYDEVREERMRREFLRHCNVPAERRFDQCPTHASHNFAGDLEFLRERLAAAGLKRILAVDLSRRRWPVAVVRVLVPGLETMHDAPGYSPGTRALRAQQALS
jgi:ribosomal protein S12 methylthiotransferase accessory factor